MELNVTLFAKKDPAPLENDRPLEVGGTLLERQGKVRKKAGSTPTSKATEEVSVIGGLWLTKAAKKRLGEPEEPDDPGTQAPLTVQKLFAMADYDKDLLWSRPSQHLASMLFTIGYLGLIIAGTVALGSGAILTGVIMK